MVAMLVSSVASASFPNPIAYITMPLFAAVMAAVEVLAPVLVNPSVMRIWNLSAEGLWRTLLSSLVAELIASPGAVPPVVGYAAVAGALDLTALALFAFLFVWQLPHFIAISIYRGEEYAEANVPMYFIGPHTAGQKRLARAVFLGSLVVLLAWSVLLVALA